jgi:hypothetical protein
MFELKKLSAQAIDAAIEQAEHSRLLNEPRQAESICLDVLEVDPNNQRTLVLLLLAQTDQFRQESAEAVSRVRELLQRIDGEYERASYEGVINERWAKALLTRSHTGGGSNVYNLLREAMSLYEKAETLRTTTTEDPTLRWNSCARLIMRHEHLAPGHQEDFHPLLE